MGKRKLQGTVESITFEEAKYMEDGKVSELVALIISVVDQLPEDACDEDERANIKTNLAMKIGELLSCATLKGMLMDPDEFVSSIPHNEGVKVVED